MLVAAIVVVVVAVAAVAVAVVVVVAAADDDLASESAALAAVERDLKANLRRGTNSARAISRADLICAICCASIG